ncbi:hypothetical protein ACFQFC_08835 [Amorphoplanes digitatis]|uniref:Uncharacterized protein n=1 Tax=Actinoplanes digitatis TaxID=1868 RepID=A0A7W7I154_9ACTN|nr:hypothetical protein [Actinoplanes digitatis]MBB4764313.1 hypothetical protein [Actinoplanes digitatis]BFE73712.1 hypothetical protein GCM10020092_070130 [Actinoplanes digitatis]GID96295.1 hypothetical protein Adi01nite_57070 [Actinoplanes digitatis]
MAPPPGDGKNINDAGTALKDSTEKVADQHRKTGDALDKLISTVNGTLSDLGKVSWLGGLGGIAAAHFYGDKVHDAMERLKKAVVEVLALVKKILDEGIPVFSLITRAFDWLDRVHAPVTAMSDTAAQYTINVNNWDGPAKRAYDQRVPIQVKAIDGLAAAGGDMASWLAELAAANAAYIVSLFKPLFDIAGALGAAIVDAATVVGALEAIGKSGELVQIAVNAMYEGLENGVNHVTEVVNKMVDAKKVTGELGDSWPQMVTM